MLAWQAESQLSHEVCAGSYPSCTVCPAGKYLLVKDPNKPQLRIYAVPAEEVIDSQVGRNS